MCDWIPLTTRKNANRRCSSIGIYLGCKFFVYHIGGCRVVMVGG